MKKYSRMLCNIGLIASALSIYSGLFTSAYLFYAGTGVSFAFISGALITVTLFCFGLLMLTLGIQNK